MYHIGVIRALFEEGLLPKIISGSSVGSIAASFLCIHKDEELPALFNMDIWDFDIFESSGDVRRKLVRFLKKGVLMDPKKLEEWLRRNFGDLTFKEAFDRTGKILNIAVSSVTQYEVPRILNYLTSPNVVILLIPIGF
jgi:predicted acylesterase/phospholipase RssA